jgi:hypothetical protein
MKTLLALALTILLGIATSHADIPAPRPLSVTVTNLAGFPQYKFFYHSSSDQTDRPIVDGRTFSAIGDVKLRVESGSDSRQTWETVEYDVRGSKVALRIENVKQDGGQIAVTYKVTSGSVKRANRSASTGAPWVPLFTLAGMSACALVVLARRRPSSQSS